MRAISRLTGASFNTVSKLMIDAGKACAAYHHENVVGVEKHRHLSRAVIDKMFFRALRVTATERLNPHMGRGLWRLIRPNVIYCGVTLFGLIKERTGYFKPGFPKYFY